jgi:hypothetical protein
MSGPKSASYSAPPESAEQRQRRQLRASISALRQQCEALRHDFEQRAADDPRVEVAWPAEPPTPTTADLGELEQLRDAWQRHQSQLREAMDAATAAARVDRLRSTIAGAASAPTAPQPAKPSKSPTLIQQEIEAGVHPDAPGVPAGTVEEIVAGLRADVNEATAEQVQAEAASLIDAARAGGAVGSSAVAELRARVQTANRAVARREADRATAREALAAMDAAGVDDHDLREAVTAAADGDGAWTDALAARAQAATEAAAAHETADVVTTHLQEVLDELGYDVGETFATDLVEDGLAHAGVPVSDEHELRVRLDPAEGQARFHLVGVEGRTTDDVEVERAWCEDYRRATDRLADQRVTLETVSAMEPGAVPVAEVTELATGRAGVDASKRQRRDRGERPEQRARRIGDDR